MTTDNFEHGSWHLWKPMNTRRGVGLPGGGVPYMWDAFEMAWATDADPKMAFTTSHTEMKENNEYVGPCSAP